MKTIRVAGLFALAMGVAAGTGTMGCEGEAGAPAPVTAALGATVDTGMPAPAAEIAPLLLARHAADLPGCDALARHGDPVPALEALAREDARLVVRARALMLWGECGGPAAQGALVTITEDRTVHPKLRAAALEGLSRAAGAPDETVRAAAGRLSDDADPRIASAAKRLLSD